MNNLRSALETGKISWRAPLRFNPNHALGLHGTADLLPFVKTGSLPRTSDNIKFTIVEFDKRLIGQYIPNPKDPAAIDAHARRIVTWQGKITDLLKAGSHSGLGFVFGNDFHPTEQPLFVRDYSEFDLLRAKITTGHMVDDNFVELTTRIARESLALRYLDNLVGLVDTDGTIAKAIEDKITTTRKLSAVPRIEATTILYSGPSGVGKGTIFDRLEGLGYNKFVITNTRDVRPGKETGDEYDFLSGDAGPKRSAESRDLVAQRKKAYELAQKTVRDMSTGDKVALNVKLAELAGVDIDSPKFNQFENELYEGIVESVYGKNGIPTMAKRLVFWNLSQEPGKGFISIAMVRSDMQGISRDFFTKVSAGSERLIIEVDAAHARNLTNHPDYQRDKTAAIFVLPPSANELASRLITRMSEDQNELNKRYASVARDIETSMNLPGIPLHDYYIENGEIDVTIRQFQTVMGTPITERVSALDPSSASFKIEDYLSQLNNSGRVPIDFRKLNRGVSEAELDAIKNAIVSSAEGQLTTTILDEIITKLIAAGKISTSEVAGSLCFQPGTDNPYHYGHATAGLAATIVAKADGYLALSGGNVPDKSFASTKAHREAMANLTISDVNAQSGQAWAGTSAIRAEVADHFADLGSKFGINAEAQRSMMDILAFKLLMKKNPHIKFFYVIGSDKFASYAEKNERALIQETLANNGMKIIFFQRTGMEMSNEKMEALMIKFHRPDNNIQWLKDLWDKREFFIESKKESYAGASSTKVRAELSSGNRALAEKEIPGTVLDYILNEHPKLKEVFKLQNENEATMKALKGLLAQIASGEISTADANILLQQLKDEIEQQKERATALAGQQVMEEAATNTIHEKAEKLTKIINELLK